MEDRAEKGQATPPAGQVSGSDRRRRLRRNAKLFRALGHESRLMILTILETGEHCVCDLAEETGLDQSTVSKHLALLAGNELVDSERRRLRSVIGMKKTAAYLALVLVMATLTGTIFGALTS